MSNAKTVRNVVIAFFLLFFISAGVGIFVAVRMDKVAKKEAAYVKAVREKELADLIEKNALAIRDLEYKYTRINDSLTTVIVRQEMRVKMYSEQVAFLRQEQKILSDNILKIRTERDSVLSGIKIN